MILSSIAYFQSIAVIDYTTGQQRKYTIGLYDLSAAEALLLHTLRS
jgi:hypothetical protein